MTQTLDSLLEIVAECQKACNQCFDASLKEDHVEMMADCIRTDRDCADICGMVLNFAYRDSALFPELLALCAKACDACADECEKHDHDHCKQCAKVCRASASACRRYLEKIAE